MKLQFRAVFLWEYLVAAAYRGSWPWFSTLGLLTQHAETIPELLGPTTSGPKDKALEMNAAVLGILGVNFFPGKTDKQDSDTEESVGFYL